MTINTNDQIRLIRNALIATCDARGIAFSDASLKPVATTAFMHADLALPIFILAGLKLAGDVDLAEQHFSLDVIEDARTVTQMKIVSNPMVTKLKLAEYLTPLLVLAGLNKLLEEIDPARTTNGGTKIYSIDHIAEHLNPDEDTSDAKG